MRHYYATGNGGSGTSIYAFTSKTERDDFVAWAKGYDQKSKISRNDARRYGRVATLIVDGQFVPNGYSPKTVDI